MNVCPQSNSNSLSGCKQLIMSLISVLFTTLSCTESCLVQVLDSSGFEWLHVVSHFQVMSSNRTAQCCFLNCRSVGPLVAPADLCCLIFNIKSVFFAKASCIIEWGVHSPLSWVSFLLLPLAYVITSSKSHLFMSHDDTFSPSLKQWSWQPWLVGLS